MGEIGLYILIRQLVNTKEWLSACELIMIYAYWTLQIYRKGVERRASSEHDCGLPGLIRCACFFSRPIKVRDSRHCVVGMERCCRGSRWVPWIPWVEEGGRRFLLRLEARSEGDSFAHDYVMNLTHNQYILKVKRSLRNYREKNDARGVLGVLETCIRTNFAGVESSR
jgi:hypothetical protein